MTFAEWRLNGIAASSLAPLRLRLGLLRRAGATLGDCVIRFGGTYVGDLQRLFVGDGTFINVGVQLYSTGGITIGRRVAVGPGCLIMTGTHEIGDASKRASTPSVFRPVTIHDGAWIGANVIIQGGVTVGPGAVVAAGSVVTRDVEANGIYAGVPATRRRDLS